ncbi:SS18-like protein 2 [Leptodactylus fuscus]|uniref:SS18-like protein 2 n=1 Tax=Leptodactylus fuscus TaxID=238119 RepID=UPI003F4EAFE6
MSLVFVPDRLRGRVPIPEDNVQRLLEENDQLIRCIVEYQNKGRAVDCLLYQQVLHRNLIYLATIADSTPLQPEKPT